MASPLAVRTIASEKEAKEFAALSSWGFGSPEPDALAWVDASREHVRVVVSGRRVVDLGRAWKGTRGPLPAVSSSGSSAHLHSASDRYEWWRGRTDAREEILAACQIVASLEAAKAAGIALARAKEVDCVLTIDAIVMATAAPLDAIVVTGDPEDFVRLASQFSGVPVVSA